jgi:5-formyltetrahydrofolate cyclo-ligase
MAEFGEVSCQPFVAAARLRGKRIFAPVLRKNALLYAPLHSSAKITRNRYGIPEPMHTRQQLIAPRRLDIVLVPLVAFDNDLNRLGMGGGYYDRTFAFRQRRQKYRKPRLVGLGYSFQHVSQLQPAPWDVPLDCAVTETESLP